MYEVSIQYRTCMYAYMINFQLVYSTEVRNKDRGRVYSQDARETDRHEQKTKVFVSRSNRERKQQRSPRREAARGQRTTRDVEN